MTINDFIKECNAEVLSAGDLDRQITGGMVCDLLSWVMAGGKQGMAWITVQTHLNVVAVAALHDIACVILPQDIKMEGAPLDKAKEEGITVLSCPASAFELCGVLYAHGVR